MNTPGAMSKIHKYTMVRSFFSFTYPVESSISFNISTALQINIKLTSLFDFATRSSFRMLQLTEILKQEHED